MSFDETLEHVTGPDRPERGVCIGWSGGLDSTVLVHLLVRARDEGRLADLELAAVHVDHGLRDDSEKDAAFCRRLAARWNLPFVVARPQISDRSSTQANARSQRYAALARLARRFDLDVLATAHHADDAVETALLNMARGSNSRGMASLAPSSADAGGRSVPAATWSDLRLVRPLANLERSQLEAYAQKHDLSWRRDPTNQKLDYTRNRLRHTVIPELKTVAGATRPLLNTLENLASESETIERAAEALGQSAYVGRPSAECIVFETEILAERTRGDEAVVARLLQNALRSLPAPARWSHERLTEALDALRGHTDESSRTITEIDLSGAALTIEPQRTTLELSRKRGTRSLRERRAEPIECPLADIPATLPWFDRTLSVTRPTPDDPLDFPTEPDRTWFDGDALPETLIVRGPKPGETLAALGMKGHKSVTDVLQEHDVPQTMRWRWPCITTPGDDLLWIAGLRRSELAPITNETRSIVSISTSWK